MPRIHRITPSYSHNVGIKSNYGNYKSYLQNDFNKSCGYCSTPDFIWGGKVSFQIDHFAPKKQFPDQKEIYVNLVYSCPICNRGKSNFWPSNSHEVSVVNDEGFIHPCTSAYDEHLYRSDNGEIKYKSDVGFYMYQKMKFGLKRHSIIWLVEELRSLIEEVKLLLDDSVELKSKYLELCAEYYEYNEVFRSMIDDR